MSLENDGQSFPEGNGQDKGLQDEGIKNLPVSDAPASEETVIRLEETASGDAPPEAAPGGEPAQESNEAADAAYYRESIRKMQEELRRVEMEEKQRRKQEKGSGRGGLSAGGCVGLAVLCTVIGCLVAVALLVFLPTPDSSLLSRFVQAYGKNNVTNVVTVPPPNDVTINVSELDTDSFTEAVYQKAKDSCVGIRVIQTTGRFWNQTTKTVSEGSGVIYSKDGLIVTNYHVVESALNTGENKIEDNFSIQVFLETDLSVFCVAELIGFDETTDLALLKITVNGDLLPIKLADSSEISVGETAVAIGSPGGLEFMNSVSSGIISGIDRNISTESGIAYGLLQTDAAINPGNSGGALVNKKGELIGICVMKLVSTGYEGMGFAITSNTIQQIVEVLKTEGKVIRPSLGVTVDTTYNLTLAEQMGFPSGALVVSVEENSAAAKGGVRADDIICAVNGETIKSFYDLRKELLKCNPGDSVELKVFRTAQKEELTLTVVLDEAK